MTAAAENLNDIFLDFQGKYGLIIQVNPLLAEDSLEIYTHYYFKLDLMDRITSSGCARNDWITRDEVSCDPVVPSAATRRDPTHQIQLLK